MPSRPRSVHPSPFEASTAFDEQLYHALRHSPWWMISIAVHVMLFVLSSMFQTATAAPPASVPLVADMSGSAEQPPEAEPPDPTVEVEGYRPHDALTEPDPAVEEKVDPSDKDRTDNEQPFDEPLGENGSGAGPFPTGTSTNRIEGLGGGASSGLRGRGSNRTTRRTGNDGRKSEDALDHALAWLAAHQSPDGRWEAAGFMSWCDGKPAAAPVQDESDRGSAQHDVGVSGLALLAFLGAGYTSRSEGAYGAVVARGLRWVKNEQDAEGCFGPRASGHYVYDHATAALAMVEAFAMTGSGVWRVPAQKGLDFLAMARNPYFAWRYGVKPGDNDLSVTGWMMMALKSARMANAAAVKAGKAPPLAIDEDAFDGIRAWVSKMTDPDTGRCGYQVRGAGSARPVGLVDRFPAEKTEAMTAVGMLARVFLGENPKASDAVRKGADLCARLLPTWSPSDGSIDMYYWYYGTLAMFQVGGEPWKKWDTAMKTAIVDTQRADGDTCRYKGSWDPLCVWGHDGGRVYSTALMAMCLEVYYRYPKVFTGNE